MNLNAMFANVCFCWVISKSKNNFSHYCSEISFRSNFIPILGIHNIYRRNILKYSEIILSHIAHPYKTKCLCHKRWYLTIWKWKCDIAKILRSVKTATARVHSRRSLFSLRPRGTGLRKTVLFPFVSPSVREICCWTCQVAPCASGQWSIGSLSCRAPVVANVSDSFPMTHAIWVSLTSNTLHPEKELWYDLQYVQPAPELLAPNYSHKLKMSLW